MVKRIRIKKIPTKSYDDIIKDINKNNIPREWTYDLTSTLPKVIIACLYKYLEEADKMVILEPTTIDEILDIINELEVYGVDEDNIKIEETFKRVGEILPRLWW